MVVLVALVQIYNLYSTIYYILRLCEPESSSIQRSIHDPAVKKQQSFLQSVISVSVSLCVRLFSVMCPRVSAVTTCVSLDDGVTLKPHPEPAA